MAIHIYEFLYRGRSPSDVEPPAWHLILADEGTDSFGRPYRDTATLNMAEAEARGWTLPAIIAGINDGLMREVEGLRSQAQADADRIASSRSWQVKPRSRANPRPLITSPTNRPAPPRAGLLLMEERHESAIPLCLAYTGVRSEDA